jgi:hypothetical protein
VNLLLQNVVIHKFNQDVKVKKKVKKKNNYFLLFMAHLINAKAMRIGWEQDWCDIWFSKDKYYCDYLYSCFRIRYFLIFFFFSKHIDKLGFIYSHFFISIFYKSFSVYLYFYDSGLEIKHDNFKREYRKLIKTYYRSTKWSIRSTKRWAYNKFFKNKYW